MELDFETIQALSSPTRVKILHEILDKGATPTYLSKELEKSKSTISSHLSTLADAGLVEREAKAGRRRVTYRPTKKAKAIVEGRERTVRFSIASSLLTSFAGAAVLGQQYFPRQATTAAEQGGASLQMESMDAAGDAGGVETATKASGWVENVFTVENGLVALGAVLVVAGLITLYYGWQLRKLQKRS